MTETTTPESDLARTLLEQQITMLGQMAEKGLDLAMDIHARSKAEDADLDAAALAYARASRSVRLSLAMQGKVIAELQAWEAKAVGAARTATLIARAHQEQAAEDQKDRVVSIVEQIADSGDHQPDEVERLVDEARERLDHEDFSSQLLARPLSELVAMICKDLGLALDGPNLTRQAWARGEAASGAVGWPLAGVAPPKALPLNGEGWGWGVSPQDQMKPREAVSIPP